jgi:hypothetical protein
MQPRNPAELLSQLLTLVMQTNPGYTYNLPGALVEDIASTDVAAMSVIDSARVELVNSLTPFGANAFLLNQLGQVYGVQQGQGSNTSVFVVFTGPPGFVIGKGFLVSDGNFQYSLIDGGIVGTDGLSRPLFALATQSGSWAVPAGTVTQLITSVPTGFNLSVVNQIQGVPGTGVETEDSYRARCLMAGLAASQGMARYLKTLLTNVPGVQPRLISVQQVTGVPGACGWIVICGGGDSYEVSNAIYMALFNISELFGSVFHVVTISQANPGQVTIDLNHGYVPGEDIVIAGVAPINYDQNFAVLSVPSEKTFTLGKKFGAVAISTAVWAAGNVTLTTAAPHGITPGSKFTVISMAPQAYNGVDLIALAGTTATTVVYALAANPGVSTVMGQINPGIANFSTVALPAYVSGGTVTPNPRNDVVTIIDYPDAYLVTHVNPPQQDVTMTILWNTSSPNFVATDAVAQAVIPAIVDYVNNVVVGQPMNVYQMQTVFQTAVYSILPPYLISRMVFQVAINGIGTPADIGTGLIEGDPQSYFYTVPSSINVVQG